jgi:hypothetical protein
VAGRAAYNEQQLQRLEDPLPWTQYLANPDFWSRTLQNWQSEFLAVASTAVLSGSAAPRRASQSESRTAARASKGDARRPPALQSTTSCH